MVLLAVVVGTVTSYAALGFLWAIDGLHVLFFDAKGEALYVQLEEVSGWYLLLISAIGAFVVRLIVQYWLPEQRNHGPADVIEASRLKGGNLSIRAGVGSAVASIISIGSGASVGRYGPAVHLGASLGSWLAQLLKLTNERKKNLLACGVAGAIAASFSAPLAGVVFAHEVVLGRFGSKSVMPIVISSVVATAIVKVHAKGNMIFVLPDPPVFANLEYFLFAFVGIIGGALAVVYMFLMVRCNQLMQQYSISALTKSLLGGLLLGCIVVIYPQTFGLGEQIIRDALHYELTADVLLTLLFAKLLATSISFAAGFSGGVFGPALFLGAMLGTAFGIGVQGLEGVVASPSVYTVVGMGAVVSRVIGAPIATILIVFEITGNYSLMTAVMVSVVVGGTVTRELFNRSYFYHQLRARGTEPEVSQVQQHLNELPISALAVQPYILKAEMTLQAAQLELKFRPFVSSIEEVYVVNKKGQLIGQVHAVRLINTFEEKALNQSLTDILTQPPVVFTKEMSVYCAYLKIKNFKGVSVPVVDGQTRQFVGVIYMSKLVDGCLQGFEKFRTEER